MPRTFAKLRNMMKMPKPLQTKSGQYGFRSPDAAESFRSLPGWDSAARAMSYGKSSPRLLGEIAPIAAPRERSIALVLCNGKPAVFGRQRSPRWIHSHQLQRSIWQHFLQGRRP